MMPTLLHAVARKAESLTPDADLLARFASERDHCAFEELVRRHGPLVWAVCRQTLPDHADAEDAFQAVFLTLVRSASNIRDGRALPAWLHGVAVRVALRAKRQFARRRDRDRAAAVPEADRPVSGAEWESLVAVVHEEVQRLPESERTAFVLCDLEGVSQPDAAARLGCPLGSVSGRLCKARQRLLERLAARGIAPAAVVGVGLTAGSASALPAQLFDAVKSFPASPSAASVAASALARGLTEGVAMRVKLVAATAVVVAALGMTGGAAVLSTAEAQPPGGMQPGGGGGRGGGGLQPGGPGAPGLPPDAAGGRPGAPPDRGGGPGGGPGEPGGRGGGGGPGGMMGWATAAAAWDYKFVDIKSDRKDFEKTITQNGKDGWEFCSSERFGQGELTLVFKKRKGGEGMLGGGGMGAIGGAMPAFPGGNAREWRDWAGGIAGAAMGGPGGATEARVITLSHSKADAVAKAVTEAHPKAIKVVGEPNTNMVIVVADPATMKQIVAQIERLDAKPGDAPRPARPGASGPGPATGGAGAAAPGAGFGGGPPPGMSGAGGSPAGLGSVGGPPMGFGPRPAAGGLTVVILKHAEAQEMAQLLKKVFGNTDITADSRTNQLIIRTDAKTLEELQALIAKLDVQVPKNR